MRLQASAFKGCLAKFEPPTLLVLGYNPAQTFLDEGFQGGSLTMRQLACFFKNTIWYLYGCFHMYNHIMAYGRL